ncbi:MAG: glycerol-3-phosphate acyltransferase [Chloroflexi bacterium]|nr:glycerol-3-phosphate acyltransferase [Chloroflexota bacterium]
MAALINGLVLLAVAYLLGSIPFGVIVGRLLIGRDIRTGGSGHSGATNTLRQAGWGAGVLVLCLDLAKGFLAEWLAVRLGRHALTPVFAGAAVVAGHCWPVFAGFRGGMGMATAGGAVLAVYPLGFALGVGLAALGSLVLRHSARGNVMTGLLVGPVIWLFSRSMPLACVGLAAGGVVALRALADWRRVYREVWLDREKKAEDRKQ